MRTMPAEVQPTNIVERLYVLLFMIFAVVVFAITVTQITQAFMKIFERRRLFNEDMAHVRLHLRSIEANEGLQVKVKLYLRHLFDRRRIQAKERGLFSQLPGTLSTLLRHASMAQDLQRLSLVSTMSRKALGVACSIVDVQDKLPNDVLCTRDQVADAAWVLVVGRLEVTDGSLLNGRREIKIVDEETLLSADRYFSQRTVKVILTSELLRVDKKKFIRAFLSHPTFAKSLRRQRKHSLASSESVEQVMQEQLEQEALEAAFEGHGNTRSQSPTGADATAA